MLLYSIEIQRNLFQSFENKEINITDMMRKISEKEKLPFTKCSNPQLVIENTYQPRLFFDYDEI